MKHLYILVLMSLISISLSGCLNFGKVSFYILSYKFADDGGRLGLDLQFNSTSDLVLTLIDPSGMERDTRYISEGVGWTRLNLSSYHKNPIDGGYKLFVKDFNGDIIEKKDIDVKLPKLKIINATSTWWKEGRSSYSIIEVRLRLYNGGNIPIYIDEAIINLDNKTYYSRVLENTIYPGYTDVYTSVYIKPLMYRTYNGEISLYDADGKLLSEKNVIFYPNYNLNIKKFTNTWRFDKKTYSVTIPIPNGLYSYCSSLPRPDTEDYSFYIIDPKELSFLDMLTEKVKSLYSGRDLVDFIASFSQNIKYKNETGEYPKYPIELLVDRGGDCEDKAIMAASILYNLGYKVALLRFEDHMAVGVHLNNATYDGRVYYTDDDGIKYLFLETSNVGWRLGESDKEYIGDENYTLYRVEPKPILIQSCRSPTRYKIGDTDFIDVYTTVFNIGNRDADNAIVKIKILHYGNKITVSESRKFYVPAGGSRDVHIKFNTPTLSFSKIFIDIYHAGRMTIESAFTFL